MRSITTLIERRADGASTVLGVFDGQTEARTASTVTTFGAPDGMARRLAEYAACDLSGDVEYERLTIVEPNTFGDVEHVEEQWRVRVADEVVTTFAVVRVPLNPALNRVLTRARTRDDRLAAGAVQ